MSGVSVTAIALVAVLSVLCLTALVLHLVKGVGDGYFKVKFGPFVFEYGSRSSQKDVPDEPRPDHPRGTPPP